MTLRRAAVALASASLLILVPGCGSTSGTDGGTGGGGGGGATGGGTGGGGGGADAGCTTLTVKNYLAWCAVSVGGAAASDAAQQTVCVAPGTVALTASALSGFQLGPAPWHHTAGDTGSGELGTVSNGVSSTSVAVGTTDACVWVCCEFTNGTGCPTADQCP